MEVPSSKYSKRWNIIILLLIILLHTDCSCADKKSKDSDNMETHTNQGTIDNAAIYHWKTRFDLTEEDYRFLEEHKIKKLYLRCFDVDIIYTSSDGDISVEPIATTIFGDDDYNDNAEIIPTVFMTLDALRNITDVDTYARLIVERTLAMVRHNRLGDISEMQIDCDWTSNTENKFFQLCSAMRTLLDQYGLKLSATIRLHQLKQKAPPVERGMLMIYNTGTLKNAATNNSILDYKDIHPYLSKHIRYDIPLDIALPVYSWGIWFREDQFQSIISRPDLTRAEIEKESEQGNWYTVLKEHYQGEHLLKEGDRIRFESPSASEILKVKRLALKNIRQSDPFTLTLYHLDVQQLRNYEQDELHEIYSN